jgi:riboflavin transporter FmnP
MTITLNTLSMPCRYALQLIICTYRSCYWETSTEKFLLFFILGEQILDAKMSIMNRLKLVSVNRKLAHFNFLKQIA